MPMTMTTIVAMVFEKMARSPLASVLATASPVLALATGALRRLEDEVLAVLLPEAREAFRWLEAALVRDGCFAEERFWAGSEPDLVDLDAPDVRVPCADERFAGLACEADGRLAPDPDVLFFRYVRSLDVMRPFETTLRAASYKQ